MCENQVHSSRVAQLLERLNKTKPFDSGSNTTSDKMALVGKKPYPKATVKKIIKAHSNLNIKKNADVTVGCSPSDARAGNQGNGARSRRY